MTWLNFPPLVEDYKGFILKSVLFLVIIAIWVHRKLNYWHRRGVPSKKLKFSEWQHMSRTAEYGDAYMQLNSYPYFVGTYLLLKPVLVIRHPDLIYSILVKNFSCFTDRVPLFINPNDFRTKLLINLKGNIWRWTRKLYVPSLATKRIKPMTRLALSESIKNNSILKDTNCGARRTFADFENDFSTFLLRLSFVGIYGLDTRDHEKLFSEYKDRSHHMMDRTWITRVFNGLGMCMLPVSWLSTVSPRTTYENDVKFFNNLISQSIKNADADVKEKLSYIDFVRGEMFENDPNIEAPLNAKQKEDLKKIVLDTYPTSFPILHLLFLRPVFNSILYELGRNQSIQIKLREEILHMLENIDTSLIATEDQVKHMPYLEKVILEGLRKYPASTSIQRICGTTCQFPEYNLTIEKGTEIYISLEGIQNDARFFKNPEIYDPDRFDDTESFYPFSFIPFGLGPRLCIASSYAKNMLKSAIIGFISKYKVSVTSDILPDYLTPSNMNKVGITISQI